MRRVCLCLLSLLVLASGSAAQTPALVGAIYVADTENHRIVRMADMSGAGWTTFGTKGSGPGQFQSPFGLFVDSAGQIYVADSGNHRIVRLSDMTGAGWTALEGSGQQKFDQPVGIIVGGGRIYVADAGGRVVRINDMTGAGWTVYGTPAAIVGAAQPGQFITPYGLAFDAGWLYIGDAGLHRVARINDFSGAGWQEFGLPILVSNLPGQFSRPLGIALDTAGRIYVADAGNHRVVRINDLTGAGWTAFGTRGNRDGQFVLPSSVFVSSTGRIYVTDTNNSRIVRISDMTGEGWLALGGAGAGAQQFSFPRGIFVR